VSPLKENDEDDDDEGLGKIMSGPKGTWRKSCGIKKAGDVGHGGDYIVIFIFNNDFLVLHPSRG
jgi:hypothetical protein